MANRQVKMNREGLTFMEWIRAASLVSKTHYYSKKIRAAWADGEDPTEWRAAKEHTEWLVANKEG